MQNVFSAFIFLKKLKFYFVIGLRIFSRDVSWKVREQGRVASYKIVKAEPCKMIGRSAF